MNDLMFIFFTIFLVTAIIYFLYKLMLSSNENSEDKKLQITSEEILEQIKILYKQRKYAIVETLANKYLERKSGDCDVRFFLAKAIRDQKRTYDAIEQAKIIVKLQPQNADVKIFLANCYLSISKPMNAIDVLKTVLEFDNNNFIAIKELANTYYKTNQKRSAIKMYERLDEFLDSNFEKASNKAIVGDMYAEFEEFNLAVEKYEEIVELYPANIDFRKKLIQLYQITLNYASAINLATEMLETSSSDESSLWAMQTLMEIYTAIKNYERALEYAYQIKEHPLSDKDMTEKIIAELLIKDDKISNSIEMLTALIEKNPEDIDARKGLARAYEAAKDFGTATRIYTEIIDLANVKDIDEIHYEISHIYANWAIHLFLDGKNDECFKNFSLALQYCATNPEIYARLGSINKSIKNYNEAIKNFKKALELEEKNPEYYFELSNCYEGIDSIYEQKKMLQKCLEYAPNDINANLKLGKICTIQNNNQEAIVCFKKVLEMDKNSIEAKHKLALIYEHQGKKDDAIRLYEEILKIAPDDQNIINNLKILKKK